MGDVELPRAPDEDQPPEKKGHLSRGVDAVKQSEAQRAEKQVQKVQELVERQALLERGYDVFEYSVVSIRSTLVGDKMNVGELEGTLNSWASQGWHLRSIVETSVSGRVGPGGTAGLIIVFERRVTQA
jgi:Domain of unknown function (DUF4177)